MLQISFELLCSLFIPKRHVPFYFPPSESCRVVALPQVVIPNATFQLAGDANVSSSRFADVSKKVYVSHPSFIALELGKFPLTHQLFEPSPVER